MTDESVATISLGALARQYLEAAAQRYAKDQANNEVKKKLTAELRVLGKAEMRKQKTLITAMEAAGLTSILLGNTVLEIRYNYETPWLSRREVVRVDEQD